MPSPSRIGLCLALGALTTVVVAWVLAVRVVVPVSPVTSRFAVEGEYRGIDGGRWWYHVYQRPGLTVVVRERGRQGLISFHGQRVLSWLFEWHGTEVPDALPIGMGVAIGQKNDIPAWARQPRHDPTVTTYVVTAASGRGWPCRALWYEAIMSPGTRVNRGGIDLPQSLHDLGPGPVLPYRLIPIGFAADMTLFGAAWMLLLAGPGLVRRVRRHRRGLCIECGYDLGHAGHDRCPECGSTIGDDVRTPFPIGLRAWASRSTSH